jgi:hypothetical protein
MPVYSLRMREKISKRIYYGLKIKGEKPLLLLLLLFCVKRSRTSHAKRFGTYRLSHNHVSHELQ